MSTKAELVALYARVEQIRKNQASLLAMAGADPAHASYWTNKSSELSVIGDTVEERITEIYYAKHPEGDEIVSNVIYLNQYKRKL